MKIKLDENLPESLLPMLGALGHDVDNVRVEGLSGQADADVWQAAQTAERFLITQDLDFSDIRKFSPGSHHGLMLVRLRAPGRVVLAARIAASSAKGRRSRGGVALSCSRITSCAFTARRSEGTTAPGNKSADNRNRSAGKCCRSLRTHDAK